MYVIGEQTFFLATYNCRRLNHRVSGVLATGDPNLVVVIGVTSKASGQNSTEITYTTWMMNLSQDENECFNDGHYGLTDLGVAYADALVRAKRGAEVKERVSEV